MKTTPTEELVLSVLGARRRLGEVTWTFQRSATVVKAMERLQAKGLVIWKDGVIEGSVMAALTDKGCDHALSPGYVPPATALRAAGKARLDDAAAALPDAASDIGLPDEFVGRVVRWLTSF